MDNISAHESKLVKQIYILDAVTCLIENLIITFDILLRVEE